MLEKPEALMINVPESFIRERGEHAFRRYYESMGVRNEQACFYHFISNVPKHEVTHAFVCFSGKVQYKVIVVQVLRDASPFPGWQRRHYLVVTGPVEKAPEEILQRGFRGFRYVKYLF